MDDAIAQLAKMMRARRAAGVAPYTLLLGSSLSLTPAVRRAVCDSEAWEAFWETVTRTSPEERRALMHEPLSQLDLQAGCDALAQLVGAGYFNVVLTLNVDDTLDNALKALPASEYRVWVHGEVSSREIVTALDRPTPRIKVVKLRGDVNAYKLPLTPEATFEFPDDLEDAVMQFLHHDTVIVGDLPFDDDVHRCIRGGDGALWVVTAEGNGFLDRAKRIRKVGEVIAATEFNAFFIALAEELGVGGAEETAPEVTFVSPEQRVNPYRGLEPFEPEHARYFFGREVLTEILVERLRHDRFLAVLGASGSGKSSVVRAGVLPVLAQGKLPGSENWPVLVIKPGQNPQEALAGALAATVSAARSAGAVDFARLQETRQEVQERLLREESALHELVAEVVAQGSDDRRAVVVIDQFEELFTLCPFEQRQRFIDALLYAVGQANGHTTVLLTLRADFVAQCTAYPDLSDLIASHQVWVRAMDDEGLRASIERPIWLTGMQYEPGLVPLILADVGREPGALPLLEDALWSLFEYCKAGDEVIEVREYREIGGVQGALAKRADDVYGTLTAEEQEYTRRVLLRLVGMREGQEATRRRAALDELITLSEERDPVEKVVQRLTDARLLTTTQDEETGQRVVDISHEVLIRGWPRLREWLEEGREDLLTRQRLREAAAEWERGERHESYLYRGARLAKVMEWRLAHEGELSDSERAFLDASVEVEERAAREEEARRQRELEQARALAEEQRQRAEEQARTARRLRFLTAVLAVVFLLAVGGAVYALIQRSYALTQARLSLSRQLAAQALNSLDDRVDLALLLSLEANRISDTVEARGSLLEGLDYSPYLITFLHDHTAGVMSVDFSPDGQLLASGGADGTIILWDVAARQSLDQPLISHTGGVLSVAFSPDGQKLAVGGDDNVITLWNVTDGQPIGQPFTGHTNWVMSVAFSPDGQTLASGSADGTLILWDVVTGQVIGQPLTGHTASVSSVAFSPDGQTLASGNDDATIILWDVVTGQVIGQPLTGHTAGVWSVAFSPDGQTLASGSDDATIILWDVATGQPIGQPLTGHTNTVMSVAFSPDGKKLVSGSTDSIVVLWDIVNGQPTGEPLGRHGGPVLSVAFSPDGQTLASGSFDSTIILWDVAARQSLSQALIGHTGGGISVAFSPDGRTLASSSAGDATIILWDAATGQPMGEPLIGHTAGMWSVAFSPDGQTLASGGDDGTIILWDVTTGQPIGQPLVGHQRRVWSVAFSPDGRTLASGSCGQLDTGLGAGYCDQGEIRLWDVDTRQPLGQPLTDHAGGVTSVAFSPDGQMLASSSDDQTVMLWDAATGQPLGEPLTGHANWVMSVAFSPDGKTLASGDANGTIILWNVVDRRQLDQPLAGRAQFVTSLAFSPDGRTLASGSADGTITLWDVVARQPLSEPLLRHAGWVLSIAFSPDGQTLVSSSSGGTLVLWDVSLESWQACACRRANRNLTQAEWDRFIGSHIPYERTCADLPQIEAKRLEAVGLVREGEALARTGHIESAAAKYAEAQTLDPTLEISASTWNTLCWFGSLWGDAADVMDTCERAVRLAPADGAMRDSRGLARALAGDYPGAIEDFRFFVEWSKEVGKYEQYGSKREAWIAELKAGRNPFDAATLEALRNE
jgi:WD40 repeat protein